MRTATDDELLRGLSRRDRIAQLVWPWIAGTYAPYEDETYTRTVARWVDSLHVGGVLVSVGGPLDELLARRFGREPHADQRQL